LQIIVFIKGHFRQAPKTDQAGIIQIPSSFPYAILGRMNL